MLLDKLSPQARERLLAEVWAEARKRENSPDFHAALNLPIPYPLQSEILHAPYKRKIIACGRQIGKTMMATMSAIGGEPYGGRGLFDGAYVHISSTTQDQSNVFWDYATRWLTPLFGTPGFYKNESNRTIRYRGGQIKVKTGRIPDTLRGGNVDKLILDEAAYLDPKAWGEVGQPMLAVRNGVAELYSTPKRRNWFFQLYNYANDPANTEWHTWNFPSDVNPYMSQEALDLMVSDMTEEAYKQEILAQFLEGQGSVFRYVEDRATLKRSAPYAGRFVAGVDWAKMSDYTVIVILDMQTREMVDYDRFNGVDWSLQRGRLKAMVDKWKPQAIIAESNSIGGPNIEALQAEGLPVQPFETTAVSKPPLIESLVLAFDRGEIAILNDTTVTGEFMAYERRVNSAGRSQYSAPEGLHDDIVIATALAWHGCTTTAAWTAFAL